MSTQQTPSTFTIMGGHGGNALPPIPWAVIAPHEDSAQRLHQQTLERLNARGGLTPCEALCVLLDVPSCSDHERAIFKLKLGAADAELRKLVTERMQRAVRR